MFSAFPDGNLRLKTTVEKSPAHSRFKLANWFNRFNRFNWFNYFNWFNWLKYSS